MESDLYKIFQKLPKGGLHNIHLNGAINSKTLLNLTYNSCVYFSQRDKYFKIARDSSQAPTEEDGYLPCLDIRKFWGSADRFDNHVRSHFRLSKEELESKESIDIWGAFQHKVTTVNCKVYHAFNSF